VVEAMRLKIIAARTLFNGITFLPNFMKMYHSVQKLLEGTHRQTEEMIRLLVFLESRLSGL
jgi:hypothetical protein